MSKFPVYETLAIDAAPLCQHNKIPKNIETVFCQEKPIKLEDKTRLKKIGACNTCKECKERGIPICECWWKPDLMRQHLEDTRLLRKCSIFSIEEQEQQQKQIHAHERFNNNYWGRASALKNQYKNATIIDKFRQGYRKSKHFWLKPKVVAGPGESVTWIMKPLPEIRTSNEELKEKCKAKQMRTDKSSKNLAKSSMDMYNLDPVKSFLAKIQNQRLSKNANERITLSKAKIETQKWVKETKLSPAKADWHKAVIDFNTNNKKRETKEQQIDEKKIVKSPEEEDMNIEIEAKNSKENLAACAMNKTNQSKPPKNVPVKVQSQKNNIQEQQHNSQKNNSKCKKSFVLAKTKTKIPVRAHAGQSTSKAKNKNSSNRAGAEIENKNSPTIKQDKSKNTEKLAQTKACSTESLTKSYISTSESSETARTLENEKHNNSIDEEQLEVKTLDIKSKTQSCVNESLKCDKNSTNTSQGSVKQQKGTKDNRTQSCVNRNSKRNQANDPLVPQSHSKQTNTSPNEKDHKTQSCVNKNVKSNQVSNDLMVPPSQSHNKRNNIPQNEKEHATQSRANKSLKSNQISNDPPLVPQTHIKPQINAKLKHFKEYKKSLSKIKSSHKLNLKIVKSSTESLDKTDWKPKNKLVLKYFKEKEPEKPPKQLQYPLIHSILQQYPKHLLPVVYYPEFENGKSGSSFHKHTKKDMHVKPSPLKGPAFIEFFDKQNKTEHILYRSPQIQKDVTYMKNPKTSMTKTKILPTKIPNNTAATTSTCYSRTLEKLTNFGKYQKPKLTKSRISFKPLPKGPQTNINQLLQNVIHKAYETEFRSKRYSKNDH